MPKFWPLLTKKHYQVLQAGGYSIYYGLYPNRQGQSLAGIEETHLTG
jgi:hypothetical protein